MHAQVRHELERVGLPYVDVRRTWHALDARRLRLEPFDDTHPNRLGLRLAARSIARFLRARRLVPLPSPDGAPDQRRSRVSFGFGGLSAYT